MGLAENFVNLAENSGILTLLSAAISDLILGMISHSISGPISGMISYPEAPKQTTCFIDDFQ